MSFSRFEDNPPTVFDAAYAITDAYASYVVEGGKPKPRRASQTAEVPTFVDFSPSEKAFFAAGDELSEQHAAEAAELERTRKRVASARVQGVRRAFVV
jgi:hypothetical protein